MQCFPNNFFFYNQRSRWSFWSVFGIMPINLSNACPLRTTWLRVMTQIIVKRSEVIVNSSVCVWSMINFSFLGSTWLKLLQHYCVVYCDVGGGWSHSNVLFMVLCLFLRDINYSSTIFCLWCVCVGGGTGGGGWSHSNILFMVLCLVLRNVKRIVPTIKWKNWTIVFSIKRLKYR